MMYATLTAQAAALTVVLLLGAPASMDEHRHAVQRPQPAEHEKLRCRLYFGCVPQARNADDTRP
jgi:hypothetical protein